MVATKYHALNLRAQGRIGVLDRRNQVERWGFLVLLGYVFMEFIRPQYAFPVIGILRPSLVLTVLLAFYWIRKWGIKEIIADRLLMYFLAFTAEAALWTPFATNNFWAFQAAKTLFLVMVVASVPLGLMLVDDKRRKFFFTFWMLIHAYLALFALRHEGWGPGGFLTDTNDLALALCMGIPFPYFLSQQQRLRFLTRAFYYAIALLMLAGLVWTNSRGGFVGFVCVCAYMFWLSRNKIRNFIVLVILGVIAYQFIPESYVERVESITDSGDSSRNERLLSWRIAWDMFKDNPIVGIGAQNFPSHAGRYQVTLPDYRPGDQLLAGRAAHSLWFTLMPEFGIVGTVLFLLILYGVMTRLKSSEAIFAKAAAAGDTIAERDFLTSKAVRASLIGYVTAGTFITVLYHPYVGFIVGFVLALGRAADARKHVDEAEAVETKRPAAAISRP